MKPSNFPARKNKRRQRALARMKKPQAMLSAAALCGTAYEVTRQRILPEQIARSIRTKKDRSANARIARIAR